MKQNRKDYTVRRLFNLQAYLRMMRMIPATSNALQWYATGCSLLIVHLRSEISHLSDEMLHI